MTRNQNPVNIMKVSEGVSSVLIDLLQTRGNINPFWTYFSQQFDFFLLIKSKLFLIVLGLCFFSKSKINEVNKVI